MPQVIKEPVSISARRQMPWLRICGALLLAGLLSGCATRHELSAPLPRRPFDFQKDTFAFANELLCDYHYDSHSNWVSVTRHPKPDYTLHCFVVARATRQFFIDARFAPELPKANEATYRKLIRELRRCNPRKPLAPEKRIVIPGYADLKDFSAAQEQLLKEECGDAWRSYVQRGHWRMLFPFSRAQQEKVAERLSSDVRTNYPLVVHLVRFPSLSINHAFVIFAAEQKPDAIEFRCCDPNEPRHPVTLTFDRATRTFLLPANHYFRGGRVDVYQVYHRWDY